MRVIAGKARGIALRTPEGLSTRPTADRVKEALFGSIQFDIPGSRVLDLFAGSGALGIEALSRGAAEAVFVEKEKQAAGILRANLAAVKCETHALVLETDYLAAIKGLDKQFDFVFMDPPYASGFYQLAIDAVLQKGLLKRGGRIIAEHDGSAEFLGVSEIKRKKYGKTAISFLTWE